jgi:ubiquinone/menaquinone biosynthesis C-methylase UbiE
MNFQPSPAFLDKIGNQYSGFDQEFYLRMWQPGLEVYENRLKAIDFVGQERVLDCGFGMGQWLVPLAELNHKVWGCEVDAHRVQVAQSIKDELRLTNLEVRQATTTSLPYEDNFFDAIFCYGVVFLTDLRQTLKELCRVLRPGGKVYFTANGIGWFLFLLTTEHNKSANYDPRAIAARALRHSLNYAAGSPFVEGEQLAITREQMRSHLATAGFGQVILGNEGSIHEGTNAAPTSFYSRKDYLGEDFIYEVLARKSVTQSV